jgi:lysine biosynthesis protein LysW
MILSISWTKKSVLGRRTNNPRLDIILRAVLQRNFFAAVIQAKADTKESRMAQKETSQAVFARCPDCGEKIALRGEVYLGRKVICPDCDAELEVVETSPLQLDWLYEDDFEYEDQEDEEPDYEDD